MVAASIAALVSAYFLGSIPTGYLVGRARGVDIRKFGSGNIGATNALRILGKPAGILVLAIDALKGLLGSTLVPYLAVHWLGPASETAGATPVGLAVVSGLAAVVGHNFTCWLRFRGGKGIATSAGVSLGLVPIPFLIVLAVFLLALAITRIVSLSSLIAALMLPAATWLYYHDRLLLAFGAAITCLAFLRHRANLQRLIAGTEPRMGQKPPPTPSAPP